MCFLRVTDGRCWREEVRVADGIQKRERTLPLYKREGAKAAMQMCWATEGSVGDGGWGKAIQRSSKHQEAGRNRKNEEWAWTYLSIKDVWKKKNPEEDRLIQVLQGSKKNQLGWRTENDLSARKFLASPTVLGISPGEEWLPLLLTGNSLSGWLYFLYLHKILKKCGTKL